MYRLLAACSLLSMATWAAAQDAPPLPFESWGVCPFECCTYRAWTAQDDIPVHAARSDASPVVYALHAGDVADGVTGVVVTQTPGIVRIDRPVRDGYGPGAGDTTPQLALQPGDVVYWLAPLGEGAYRFWFKGHVYDGGLDLAAMPVSNPAEVRTAWWKQVRNRAGQLGWTQSDKFANVDACG